MWEANQFFQRHRGVWAWGPEVSPGTAGKGWPVEWGGRLDVFHLNSSVFVWFSFADIPSESGKTRLLNTYLP